jgi:hypothetical protein
VQPGWFGTAANDRVLAALGVKRVGLQRLTVTR